MANPFSYTVNVTLPIGEVVAEVLYYQGHYGDYYTPPEPDEINIISLTDMNGRKVNLTDSQYEEYYYLFLEAVSEAHSAYLDKQWNQYAEDYQASKDIDIPF